jgi:flagellar assembly protein FliH
LSASRIIPAQEARDAAPWPLAPLVAEAATPGARVPDPVPPRDPGPDPVAVERERLQREMAALREAARDEGLRVGLEQGRARAADDAARLRALGDALLALDAEHEQRLAQHVTTLALEVARQLVRGALETHPDRVLTIVREALGAFAGAGGDDRCLRLHPDDAALVREVFATSGEAPGWRIVDDLTLARGGCRLQSPVLDVDASLDDRWRRIVAALGRAEPLAPAEAATPAASA